MGYYIQVNDNRILSASNLPVEEYMNIEVAKELYDAYVANPHNFYYKDGQIVGKTEEEQKQEILAEQFFPTSLGYVRRSVTMKDGTKKDFLSDILPLLQIGVPVLTYTSDLEQTKVIVTQQFIEECKQQMLRDFYGV